MPLLSACGVTTLYFSGLYRKLDAQIQVLLVVHSAVTSAVIIVLASIAASFWSEPSRSPEPSFPLRLRYLLYYLRRAVY